MTSPLPPPIVRRHLWVSGKVQGVGYRWATCQQARAGGVKGWVRNLPDGRVEAVFEGSADTLERLLNWCKDGPPGASVQSLNMIENEPVEGMSDFDVI